jgi:hypothetical protein
VYVKANGFTQRADVVSGGSFASSSDPRLHFGLGAAKTIDSIEVHWPSGTVEQVTVAGIDGIYTVTEGSGTAVGAKKAKATSAKAGADTVAGAGR